MSYRSGIDAKKSGMFLYWYTVHMYCDERFRPSGLVHQNLADPFAYGIVFLLFGAGKLVLPEDTVIGNFAHERFGGVDRYLRFSGEAAL